RQEQALCKQLADNTCRRGSERGAYCHFALTGRSTGEQQICDVDAGDEQHKANAAHKHKQRRSYIARNGIVKSLQEDAKTNIATRIFPVQAIGHGIEFATHLLQAYSTRWADTGTQPVEI